MAEREVAIGLATYLRADSPEGGQLWHFGLFGETVDVHPDDVARFDRLNGASRAETVPLPKVEPENEIVGDEPPRAGRGSGQEAWLAYAESLGLTVDESESRDEIIARVDDLKNT